MEKYLEYKIACTEEVRDLLIAELAADGFDGFVETEDGFSAFVPENLHNASAITEIFEQYQVSGADFSVEEIAQQNWNATWEADFEAIVVSDRVIIRAPFHPKDRTYEYELLIQPKNTFGTGHHETTQLMLEMMLSCSFSRKKVFDYGCGTGVLGIMASRLGAESVFAIDIDSWSAENVAENTSLNNTGNLHFTQGDLGVVPEDSSFDIILANINKNILLASFEQLAAHTPKNGLLLISGFYVSDLPDLVSEASRHGYQAREHNSKHDWCCAAFSKS